MILNTQCTATISVLPFLTGRVLDEISLGWLTSLRPSSIRITDGLVNCDSQLWRVTVILDSAQKIKSITQEVGLRSPGLSGHEMLQAVGDCK